METPVPPAAEPTRAPRGFLDQGLEDDFELAQEAHREAAKPEIAPALAAREWTPADQTALAASIARCDDLLERLRNTRTSRFVRTDEEDTARAELLAALDPILKGARRKYPDGSPERRTYGIGAGLSKSSTATLYQLAVHAHRQLAPGEAGAPPADTLKGVLPEEIALLSQLATKYRDADFAQADAGKSASELLAQLRAEVETTLNPLRRDLLGAADQAYPHRNPVNAPQRKAFGLQGDRPFTD